jgi:hypothetical protein
MLGRETRQKKEACGSLKRTAYLKRDDLQADEFRNRIGTLHSARGMVISQRKAGLTGNAK